MRWHTNERTNGLFRSKPTEDGGQVRGRSARSRQNGFTLVEIAIVLVIIGLLIGLFLKGWELQVSARVRALAATSLGVQAAYHGFTDRYDHVPGDWNAVDASAAIGASITGGGNDNGVLDSPPGGSVYDEMNGLWEQLSKGGFIVGAYSGTANTEPTVSNNLAPINVFNGIVIIGITDDYEGVATKRLHVVVGRGLPVGVARELDVKLDDSAPETGRVRATLDDADLTVFTGANDWGGRVAECVDKPVQGPATSKGPPPAPAGPSRWDSDATEQDCNAVILF
jgi:prepilin-type N-terminal cleavage/methylation domain-containing protein